MYLLWPAGRCCTGLSRMNEDDAMTIILTILLALAAYQIWVQRARLREARLMMAEVNRMYDRKALAYTRLEQSYIAAVKWADTAEQDARVLREEIDKVRSAAPPKFDKG